MRFVLALVILLAALVPISSHAAAEPIGARVLLVVSGNGRDEGRSRPGFEYDEFAQSWVVLRDNGVTVEVASPQGGPVEVDAFEPEKPYNARALADPAAQAALQATLTTGAVDPARYAGVFVLGGEGAMFDLYRDPGLKRVLEEVHAAGGVIGAVCHGPVVLAALRDAAGRPLVVGRASPVSPMPRNGCSAHAGRRPIRSCSRMLSRKPGPILPKARRCCPMS